MKTLICGIILVCCCFILGCPAIGVCNAGNITNRTIQCMADSDCPTEITCILP